MRKNLSLLIVTCLVTAAIAQTAPKASKNPANSKLESAVDTYLRPYVESNNFTGSVLIAHRGQILLQKGYGRANYELEIANTPETRFHIASVSKPFTSAAILLLQEKGLLKTSDTVAKFIPDYPSGDKITLRHLLTHTSGIPNINDFPDYNEFAKTRHTPAELVAKFKDRPLEFQPGERYRYSNSNYNLLAYVIEKVSGLSFGEFLKRNIFDPLRMSSSGHDGDASMLIPFRANGYEPARVDGLQNADFLDWSNKAGNGSLYSTPGDLYKFERALNSDRLLSKSSRDEMFAKAEGIHYGWSGPREEHGRTVIAMTGRSPGFNASLTRFIDDDACVIVLSNSYSPVSQTVIADDLASILFGGSPAPPPRLQAIPETAAKRLIGRYQFGPDYFRPNSFVEVENDGTYLEMKWEDGKRSVLLTAGDGKFTDRLYWGQVEFSSEPDGARELTYNPTRSFTAKRVQP